MEAEAKKLASKKKGKYGNFKKAASTVKTVNKISNAMKPDSSSPGKAATTSSNNLNSSTKNVAEDLTSSQKAEDPKPSENADPMGQTVTSNLDATMTGDADLERAEGPDGETAEGEKEGEGSPVEDRAEGSNPGDEDKKPENEKTSDEEKKLDDGEEIKP